MSKKFEFDLRQQGKVSYLTIIGVVDEDNELSKVERVLAPGPLLVDLAHIDRINSLGLRDWVDWVSRVERKGTELVFVNCSPVATSKINEVSNFTGRGLVKSVSLPYYCPLCECEKLLLWEVEILVGLAPISIAPSCRCDDCDGVMQFDNYEETYFAFLSKECYLNPQTFLHLHQVAADALEKQEPFLLSDNVNGRQAYDIGIHAAAASKSMSNKAVSRFALRQQLQATFRTDSDFAAFVQDHFSAVHQRFAGGMDRVARVNLLLEMIESDAIAVQLQKYSTGKIAPGDKVAPVGQKVDSESERLIYEPDPLDKLYLEREERRQSGLSTTKQDHQLAELKRLQRFSPTLQETEVLNSRYCLLKVVGRGGYATVWRALDRRQRRVVAVKVLHADQGEDPHRVDRFKRGAKQIQQLDHPHVVRVLGEPDTHRGFHFFVMDYMPGGDLYRAVTSGSIERQRALLAIFQIGSALASAHQRGLIHRDVKPENILLDEQGNARLTDFDLVWAADSTGGTRTGAMGTIVYSAPEAMADASRVDLRADVYSLAMTTIFVLNERKLTDKVVYERSEFFAELDCAPAIKAVLRRATARRPDERPPTVADFCNELERACDAAGLGWRSLDATMPAPAVGSSSKISRSRNPWERWLLAGISGVCLGGLLHARSMFVHQSPAPAEKNDENATKLPAKREEPSSVSIPIVKEESADKSISTKSNEKVQVQPSSDPMAEYQKFVMHIKKEELIAALDQYFNIPVDSEYFRTIQKQLRTLIRHSIRRLEKARKHGDCALFEDMVLRILKIDPRNARALALRERGCRPRLK